LVGKQVALTLATALRRTFAAIMRAEPMGLSDWIGIFAIITFVGFAGMFYEVATRVFDDREGCAEKPSEFSRSRPQ
jgi:hypothetical protein